MMTISRAMCVFRLSRVRAAIIVAMLCALLPMISGCSALRIGYSTAPDLVYWWLDGYVDFNADQTTRVRAVIAQWFAWHRRAELPD